MSAELNDEAIEAAARPGLDEAIEAHLSAHFDEGLVKWDQLLPSTQEWLRGRTRDQFKAAYPIIAAAVRADERAKVLREVERITEFHAMIQCPHGPKCDDPMCLGRREVASMFRALTTSGSGS